MAILDAILNLEESKRVGPPHPTVFKSIGQGLSTNVKKKNSCPLKMQGSVTLRPDYKYIVFVKCGVLTYLCYVGIVSSFYHKLIIQGERNEGLLVDLINHREKQ